MRVSTPSIMNHHEVSEIGRCLNVSVKGKQTTERQACKPTVRHINWTRGRKTNKRTKGERERNKADGVSRMGRPQNLVLFPR